jgi:hypothetical protein
MLIAKLPRQGGKTETLVYWVKQRPGRAMVVFNERERQRILREYKLRDDQVFVYTSNIPKSRGYEVAIDNLDLVLQEVYGDVQIVTVTKDGE